MKDEEETISSFSFLVKVFALPEQKKLPSAFILFLSASVVFLNFTIPKK